MEERNTQELEKILMDTHIKNFDEYRKQNQDSMDNGTEAFSVFIKNLLIERKISQQTVFLNADIPERYGYKLLSGEKRTRQRDVILRICYAAGMTLSETQRALRKYQMPELYAKIPRDAMLMIIFNKRPGSIIEVNAVLKEHDFEPLRTSGVQD